MTMASTFPPRRYPSPLAALKLIKPVTWFPPMLAYAIGCVSAGVSPSGQWGMVILGVLLAGPIVCGMSQAANDWCDRHVDAINEPHRGIPSGQIPGHWGLGIAWGMTVVALILGWQLGPWGFGATIVGVIAAWAYSAEPVRLKRSWFWGPGVCGLCYEGLPWFTGAAVLSAGAPSIYVVIAALLYSVGAHGIMTLNDFKALEGDRQMGLRSLPVVAGPERAAKIACAVMAAPQIAMVALLFTWDRPLHALGVMAVLGLQLLAMRKLLRDPKKYAPWYNGTGVLLYVSGMLITAFAIRTLGAI